MSAGDVHLSTSRTGAVFGVRVVSLGTEKVTLTTSNAPGWKTATAAAARAELGAKRVTNLGHVPYVGLDGARMVSVDYERINR